MKDNSQVPVSKQKSGDVPFWQLAIEFLFGLDSSDSERRELARLNKELYKNKYKFCNLTKGTVSASFAHFLWNVYKTIYPLREFFLEDTRDDVFAKKILNASLSDEQLDLIEYFSSDSIRSFAEKMPLATLAEDGKEKFAILKDTFSLEAVSRINDLYTSVLILKQFCLLDYYAALKRFSSAIKENDFSVKPKFVEIPKQYVQDFVVDFCSLATSLFFVQEWNEVFDFILKQNDSIEINRQEFSSMLSELFKMKNANVFASLSKILTHNSEYEVKPNIPRKDITKIFLTDVYNDFRQEMQEIVNEKKSARFSSLLKNAFGNANLPELKFYNFDSSEKYRQRGTDGFIYAKSLGYLYAFNLLHFEKEITKFNILFETSAISSSNFVGKVASKVHDLRDLQAEIVRFDQQLDSKFALGNRLALLLERSEREHQAKVQLEKEIIQVNGKANLLLSNSLSNYEELSNDFNALVLERAKKEMRLVQNWGEVDKAMQNETVSLLQSCASNLKEFLKFINVVIKG